MLIFRFTAGLLLLLLVSIMGIKLEKEELALKRTISLQQYRMDQLLEERARLRIRVHKMTGPSGQMSHHNSGESEL